MASNKNEKTHKMKAFFKAIFLKILKNIFEVKDKTAVTPH